MRKLSIFSTFLLLGAHAAYAQEVSYKLATPLPGVGEGEGTQIETFTQYVGYLFPFLLSIASVLALVVFVYGAIEYMLSSSGGGNKEGKEKMTSAVLGILLAALSVLILQTINPSLVTLDIDSIQPVESLGNPAGGGNPAGDGNPAGGFLLGIFTKDNNTTQSTQAEILCGGDIYSTCPAGNACLTNPIGDYYCAAVSQGICPRGESCAPCSQRQLEQCIQQHSGTNACVVITRSDSLVCSHE